MAVGMVSPLRHRGCRINLSVLRPLVGALLLGVFSAPPVRADSNYELAVSAKQSEIRWKQADLLAAQRDLAILTQFLDGYDNKAAQLTSARQQLASADSQLASIQQGNLVKLTIRMGIETYNTISDTISLGETAATSLVSRGVASAVGEVAMDRLNDALGDKAQEALGMDAETLSRPRTVKIKAVSDAARAAYPELARVRQAMSLSLEAVKSAAYHEDGTELGDTGAILRKNLMVRDEITAALAKLDDLGSVTSTAKTDADSRLPAAQAEVERITAELAALNTELETLKTQWRDAEAAARAAANAAVVVAPVRQSTPSVSVTRGEDEDDIAYAARVQAAIIGAARARWDADAEPIVASIATLKANISERSASIGTAVAAAVDTPSLVSFIFTYGTADEVDANTTASYEGSISTLSYLQTWRDAVAPSETALPTIISDVEALTDRYTELTNLQNRLVGFQQMLESCGAGTPPSYYTSMDVPGMGQAGAEDLAVLLGQYLTQLPAALANTQKQLERLSAATDAWTIGISNVRTDLDDNLAAAQSALAELISRGASWDSALAAAEGMARNSTDGAQYSRLGYFSGNNYVPVIRHEFDLWLYKQSLIAALKTKGTTGLTAARGLRTRYDTLVATAPALKDAYDAAWQRYQAAYARVRGYAGSYLNFPVLQDWSRAATYSSQTHPVDASGVTDQEQRFLSLYATSNQLAVTGMDGGAPVVGQPVLTWAGLPRLRQLPDPGMDDVEAFPLHRLTAVKATILESGPTWLNQPPAVFAERYNAALGEFWDILNAAQAAGDDSLDSLATVYYAELGALYDSYTAAHPAAVITTQPASSSHNLAPNTTTSVTLSVAASGDFLSYEWFTTTWPDYEYTWTAIPGATSHTYTTPESASTAYYRVKITNPGGTVVSDTAQVAINIIYPAPVFTSADHASAKVGVPFSWTFTTDITCWIFVHGMNLPPGLTFDFMTFTLSGTPTAAGDFELAVNASNNGTVTNQTFRLAVAEGTLAPFDAWLQQWTTSDQRLNPAYTAFNGTPAGDGIANLLKFAFNLLGTGPGQVAALDRPCTTMLAPTGSVGLPAISVDSNGRLTVLFVRRKAAAQPGISYAVEFTSNLAAGSWAENTSATEQVTSIDENWERVLTTDSSAVTASRFVRIRVSRP